MIQRTVLCIAALALIAGCGQKASTRNHSVMSAAPVASPAAMQNGTERNAAPAATLAPVPSSVDCGGAQPVWVNERTHVYHVAGDPYYGKTKHGRYLCRPDARKEGYREAKT